MILPFIAAAAGTSASGDSLVPETTEIFTFAHLAIVVILAVLVIAGMIYGARLKRQRTAAKEELTEYNDALREDGVEAPPTDASGAPVGDAAAATLRSPISPPPASAPAPRTPAPRSAADGTADGAGAGGPLTQIKGLGPRVAERLAEHGVTTVSQLAALTDDEAARLDAELGPFTGRMGRDRWLEQARFLAAGDKAGFEAVFGRL